MTDIKQHITNVEKYLLPLATENYIKDLLIAGMHSSNKKLCSLCERYYMNYKERGGELYITLRELLDILVEIECYIDAEQDNNI